VRQATRAVVAAVLLAMCAGAHAQLSASDGTSLTPDEALFAASYKEQVEGALQRGANIEARNEDGDTPLILAAEMNEAKAVQALLEHNANIEAKNNKHSYPSGETPLIASIPVSKFNNCSFSGSNCTLDSAKLLLEHHANVEAKDDYGRTALMEAATWGKPDACKLLLEYGANVNDTDKNGQTPLIHAAQTALGAEEQEKDDWDRYTEVVRLLLANHADLEAKDDAGLTALAYAIHNGNVGAARLLLANHADLDAKDQFGNTALWNAASRGDTRIVQGFFDEAVQLGLLEKPIPPIPQEARRPFIEANAVFKGAQSDRDTYTAIALYEEALIQAPWYIEAWNNLSLAQEKAKQYQAAADSLKNFVKLEPGGASDQATTDRIYGLEGKAKLAAQ